MRQTIAILIDAYRALNAKRLFWISLAISGLVVAAFAAVGITDKGLTIFAWQTEIPPNTHMFGPDVFYKVIFVTLGVKIWLAWIATILALVSTAGIVPDMLSEGAIDLAVSKPISRVRLYLTRFFGALLFVALQVGVFAFASFLVIGLRGGSWEPGLFLAIPLVILFFSYLYAICSLVGLLTRSTIAALLITLLAWFAIFGLNSTESVLLLVKTMQEQRIETIDAEIARRQAPPAEETAEPRGVLGSVRHAFSQANQEGAIERLRERRAELEKSHRVLSRVYTGAFAVKSVLPKTTETINLAERWLISTAELPDGSEMAQPRVELSDGDDVDDIPVNEDRVARIVAEKMRERSAVFIIGTSLAFEAVVLGLALWIFARRDF